MPVVPYPEVRISQGQYIWLYAGTAVTLTCIVTLRVRDDEQNIDILWNRLGRNQEYTITELSDGSYVSNVTTGPMQYSRDRYQLTSCTGIITGDNIQPVQSTFTPIFYVCKYIAIPYLHPMHHL